MTSGAAHTLPDTRSWGRYLVFLSNQDLGETGSTGTQIFRYSHRDYLCLNADSLNLTQTLKTDCATNPPAEKAIVPVTTGSCVPQNPVISDDGLTVVFDASGTCGGDANGVPPAARNFRQIFSKDLATGELKPLTKFTGGDSIRPAISHTGKVVAFESTATLINGFPSNGVKQVYLYEVNENRFWSFPKGLAPSTRAIMNRGGDTVAFQTRSDLLGDGHDTGVSQIFWVEIVRGKNTQPYTVHQLTDGNADSTEPYLASGAKFILFQSKATNLKGQVHVPSLSNSSQIFSGVLDSTPADLPTLTQVTSDDVYGRCTLPAIVDPESGHPDDRNGARYTFTCDGDPLQNGSTGPRAFVYDVGGDPALYQITLGPGLTGRIAGSVGVWFVALSTSEDLSGTGTCGPQIHMVDYFSGKFGAATQTGQLPVIPLPGDANASCEDNHACTTDVCQGGTTCSHTAIANCEENCPTGKNSECSDNQFCTIDKCVHFQCQITARPDTTPCNDANACTATDQCLGGVCTGLDPKVCPGPSDQCHSQGECNPTTGQCTNPVKPTGTPCSDGDLCTQTDTCDAGICKGSNKVTCSALNQCYNKGTCDPGTGQCTNPPKNNGTTCNDGNLCTQTDTCQSGICTGSNPVTCPAGSDACHVSTCEPSNGQCGAEHLNTCDDANDCTTDGVCDTETGCPPPITIPLCTTTTTLPTTTTTSTSAPTTTTTAGSTSTTTTVTATTIRPTTTTLVSASGCVGMVGFDAVLCRFDKERTPGDCASDTVPAPIQSRFSKARGLIERASFSNSPKTTKRLLKKAGKTLKAATPLIARASKGRSGVIGPDCSAALKNFISSTRSRISSLTF